MAPHTVPFYINGEELMPEKTFALKSPTDGSVISHSGIATVSDANAAVEAAAAALPAWRDMDTGARRDIFLKAADVMKRRQSELAGYMGDELGTGSDWSGFCTGLCIGLFKDVAGRISSIEGSVPKLEDPTRSAMVWREPYGVVLAIAPWNGSYPLGTRAVLYPLAAGCTVVLKGSELSPRAMHGIVSVLHEAGLPPGVLNFITTDSANAAAVTESIIANPHIKKVNFTGSTAVGRLIAKVAGQHLKPLVLELGGKAPAIIWEDADLDNAAHHCSVGAFLNSGQVCMSTERLIVHKSISEKFAEKLREKASEIWSKPCVLITEQAVEKNKKLLSDATSKGASVVFGDVNAEESNKSHMRPVIISQITSEMDIYKQESFGPTVSMIEVESEEEALRVANDTEYGLTSSVFTEDLRRGFRFAKGIEAGAVHINSMTIHDETALPHGGAKASGYGRFNASLGIEEYLRTKNVTWRN
ncbi:aldehyde dehydrogenase [Xylariaceae sp. FL1019]|nr:aldehyde dehydrogenase [Xylariaceae sp. FL1019]